MELPTARLFGKDGRRGGCELAITAQLKVRIEVDGLLANVIAFVQPDSEQQCLLGMNALPALGLTVRRANGENLLLMKGNAKEQIENAQQRQKKQYDRHAKDPKIQIGDRVMVHMPGELQVKEHKLVRPFHGPYRVLKVHQTILKWCLLISQETVPIHRSFCKLRHLVLFFRQYTVLVHHFSPRILHNYIDMCTRLQ